MLIVHDRFIFLATPRTGSRAVVKAFKDDPEFPSEESEIHHDIPEDALEAQQKYQVPLITVLRNPYDQILSWYAHAVLRNNGTESLIEFIKNTRIGWYFDDELNMYSYMSVNPHYVLYRKEGLVQAVTDLSNELNGTSDKAPEEQWVGGSAKYLGVLWTPEARAAAKARWPKDFELWTKVTNEVL